MLQEVNSYFIFYEEVNCFCFKESNGFSWRDSNLVMLWSISLSFNRFFHRAFYWFCNYHSLEYTSYLIKGGKLNFSLSSLTIFKCSPITPRTLHLIGDLNMTFFYIKGDLLLSKLLFTGQLGLGYAVLSVRLFACIYVIFLVRVLIYYGVELWWRCKIFKSS